VLLSTAFVVRRILLVAIAAPMLWLPVRVLAQSPAAPEKVTSQPTTSASQPAKPDIFDSAADAKAQIAAAIEKAARENQRVLIMFGGNWCGWCRKLHGLFTDDKDIAKTLLYEYQLVMVDVGRFDKNVDITGKYGLDRKKGVPFLVVLDGDGKTLAGQETGSLEAGDHHDPEKVAAFLDKWKAQPRDAEKTLADALARARGEGKTVLVHLGAPWCPWCRRLDDFLARKDIAEIIKSDVIDLKIDVDRMTGGKTVAKRLRKTRAGSPPRISPGDASQSLDLKAAEDDSLPWMVLLDDHGKTITTSDGPQGNIGYPAEPEEISHFIAMLKKAGKRISSGQLAQVEKALKEAAPKRAKPAP